MSALAVERQLAPAPSRVRRRDPRVAGSVRAGGPAVPVRPTSAPTASAAARACVAEASPRVTVTEGPVVVTRLTDRGIAVILVLMALLVAASIACVGVTAARVTAEPTVAAAGVSR